MRHAEHPGHRRHLRMGCRPGGGAPTQGKSAASTVRQLEPLWIHVDGRHGNGLGGTARIREVVNLG
jgi:hypothetical protein